MAERTQWNYELHWNATTISRSLSHLPAKNVCMKFNKSFPNIRTWNSYSIIKEFSSILKPLLLYYKLRGINIVFLPNIRLYPHTAFFRFYIMTASDSVYKLRFTPIRSMKLRWNHELHWNATALSRSLSYLTAKKVCMKLNKSFSQIREILIQQ
jgi:hypothetical protein